MVILAMGEKPFPNDFAENYKLFIKGLSVWPLILFGREARRSICKYAIIR
jgi:hypothetical protein